MLSQNASMTYYNNCVSYEIIEVDNVQPYPFCVFQFTNCNETSLFLYIQQNFIANSLWVTIIAIVLMRRNAGYHFITIPPIVSG